jgi:GNAT superfamily N-acetyltransferase
MEVALVTDPREFHGLVWPYLEARSERNVLATVLLTALDGRYDDVRALYGYWTEESGAVAGVALRTPPFRMLASELDPAGCSELLDVWLAEDPALPGVNSFPSTARGVAAEWRARTGGKSACARSMAMHALETVTDPPHPHAGELRLGAPAEREQLIAWHDAFATEAGAHGGAHAIASVDSRLASGDLFVWDDGGPRSVVAISPAVAGVVRIGPVYTPPEFRRRGYAGMAVAEVTRRALARGARGAMLFTDLANPTSNKIYAEVGYRRFGDWEEHRFAPPDAVS